MRFLAPYAEYVLGIARILIGINFATHGAQKLLGVFGGAPAQMPAALLYPAGVVELVCGALVAVGLFAAPAAFIASGQMAIGYFLAHASRGFWPIENQGELAIAYCWFFLYIAAKGPGALSVGGRRGAGEKG
jgi:putative oxidoreductase